MSRAYIYDAGRTAFGRHGGALSPVRPDDMLGHVIKTHAWVLDEGII